MFREDFIRSSAAAHVAGARFLRDTAAAYLPCYTLDFARSAIESALLLSRCEELLSNAVSLSAGLTETGFMSKYTVSAESRMRLLGVELSPQLSSRQIAAERVKDVPPGTRGEVYEGFVGLAKTGGELSSSLVKISDALFENMRAGKLAFALPLECVAFLRKLCADYGAVCAKLGKGEEAELRRRRDESAKFHASLSACAAASGVKPADDSPDALASLSASGHIPSLPAVLFDVLVRYESLPALLGDK